MNILRHLAFLIGFSLVASLAGQSTPVRVSPVVVKRGIVVAGHPQAADAGLGVLKAGGNAIDAAIATSLSLGVAEPYASGLGGKLLMIYYEAESGNTYVIDALDTAGSVDIPAYLKRPEDDHHYGYGAACVPGLPAGLWLAQQKWGSRAWSANVAPAIALARDGVRMLPKSRELFEEQIKKLQRGDPEIARIYLSQGQVPIAGRLMKNAALVHTLERLAQNGRDGFYRGPVAEAIAAASAKGGGSITLGDLAKYEARLTEPIGVDFRGYRIESAPPPTTGAAMFLPALKVLENQELEGGTLRTAANLDRIGRVWAVIEPEIYRIVGDAPGARSTFERLVAPASIRALQKRSQAPIPVLPAAAALDESFAESASAATTHFIVVDSHGNVVCATQSLSVHFGAGVVPPGTGVVLNNSMSNFDYADPKNPNYIAAGHRPRTSLAPTLVLLRGQPVLALGIPGSARIPTGILQVLLDYLVLHRRMTEAIGDTRFHFMIPWKKGDVDTFEAEASFPASQVSMLHALGWKIDLSEPAGRGRHFGGVNAVELAPDGRITGYADPRRTNAAEG